ncbi:MAG: hypothetical protein KGL39_09035 [Patescibacteria group bacterium]|nr:hypothetical protein [Patescibacteria group bacterium]
MQGRPGLNGAPAQIVSAVQQRAFEAQMQLQQAQHTLALANLAAFVSANRDKLLHPEMTSAAATEAVTRADDLLLRYLQGISFSTEPEGT